MIILHYSFHQDNKHWSGTGWDNKGIFTLKETSGKDDNKKFEINYTSGTLKCE